MIIKDNFIVLKNWKTKNGGKGFLLRSPEHNIIFKVYMPENVDFKNVEVKMDDNHKHIMFTQELSFDLKSNYTTRIAKFPGEEIPSYGLVAFHGYVKPKKHTCKDDKCEEEAKED